MSIVNIEITPSGESSVVVDVIENQIIDNTGGTGGIEEAPVDGQQYARKNADWSLVDVPNDAVEEAPNDGKQYARKSQGWSEVDSEQEYSKVAEVSVGGVRVGDLVEPDIKSALDSILSLPFVEMTYSYSINYSLVEKGLSVTPTSSWNINSNNDVVTNVSILRNNVEESNEGTTLVGSYSHLDSISSQSTSSQKTYKINIQSDDAGLSSTSRSVSFVAPTYSGVLLSTEIDQVNIKTLTKYIRNKANQNNVPFSPTLQRYVYAYPKSFGLLTSIKDPSNFEVIGSYDVSEITFQLADFTPEAMYVYVSNADTTQTNFQQDFIF